MASQFALTPEKKRRIAEAKQRAAEAEEDYDPKAKAAPKRTVEVKPKGELKKADEGVRGAIRGSVIDLGSQFGLKPERARYFGDIATDVADIVPGVGETVGTAATAEALQNRDWRTAALEGGGLALGAVPVIGDIGSKLLREKGKEALAEAMAPGIRAYHGSPHSFEKFDISKIGTGEGAQAYGHGLYFAEHEPTAASYRESLAGPSEIDELKIGSRRVGQKTGFDYSPRGNSKYENIQSSLIEDLLTDELALTADPAKAQQIAIDKLKQRIADYRTEWPEAVPDAQRLLADLSRPGAVSLKMGERPGHMYEVNIAADPEQFLDWDKPLSEQQHLLPAMNQAGYSVPKSADLSYLEQKAAESGPDSWYALQLNAMKPQIGKPASEFVPRTAEASEALKQAGIPGIKYLDQGSRTAGGGSRNYVVFDENLISIVKKYGIAAALGAGLISQQMADQMRAQGLDKT